MKRALAAAITLACLSSPAHAASVVPTPPTTTVELNTGDIQLIEVALHLAASTCDANVIGCDVGKFKAAELQKLDAALAALQAKSTTTGR